MIYFIFFLTNCSCFLVFAFCLAAAIYFYAENTIGQDIGEDISTIIIIFLMVFFILCFSTLIGFCGCLFKNLRVLRGYIIILSVIFGGAIGGVLFFNHQYGTAGILLVVEIVVGKTLAYQQELNILIYVQILFYGIPVVIFINIVMAFVMFLKVNYTDMNKRQTIESGEQDEAERNYDNIYNEIHLNPQNDNPPTNPYYQQELTVRTETAIPTFCHPISDQDQRNLQQDHTSLSHDEPPSYHEAAIMSIQSTPEASHLDQDLHEAPIFPGPPTPWYTTQLPSYNEAAVKSISSMIGASNPIHEASKPGTGVSNPMLGAYSTQANYNNTLHTTPETYFQRQIRPIQPPLPQEAPPPYQLWMLRVSKRLKRTRSKSRSKNVQSRQFCLELD